MYGAIEAGGTKFLVAVGSGPRELSPPVRFETSVSDPRSTLAQVIDYLVSHSRTHGTLHAIGVGAFGPVDYATGTITTTPKTAWRFFPLREELERALGVPVGLDTDVNAAALGEGMWGAAQGLSDFVYLTIGTGIGGGAVVNGALVHGLLHPEMGHAPVPRHPAERPDFQGVCPWHKSCLEGLASGPAIAARWGAPAESLPPGHQAWEMQSWYLAHAVVGLICFLSPKRVILGGGVMRQIHLFPLIRGKTAELLNGYLAVPEITQETANFIVPPALEYPGLVGALALARAALGR